MELTLAQISEMVDGEVLGDAVMRITGAAAFENATINDITYASRANFLKKLNDTAAGAIIVPRDTQAERPLIRVNNPELAFASVLGRFHPRTRLSTGIHPSAVVGEQFICGQEIAVGACAVIQNHITVGDRVEIHPNVVIGDHVEIGDDVLIYPNVTILERCRIGSRVVIHAGSVIGSDGFGFVQEGGRSYKIPQVGVVQIDDDVEIGAGNTIDRATFGTTWIKAGVKTDNMVHFAHNVIVGENSLAAAQVGVAGSVRIGKNVILAGKSAIAHHLTIGDHAIVGGKAGIGKSVPE
ncbi:MAG: UDP-3-O-(3-hydroxymyristoyl)glucosamine N-acyltransferase, partial [Deltaproteobacteria bacterium]|nr:UDP-3-O-(3-hydroxymyristoyl)glucosamine N-acyltransferase [Deltaproteobacteria bacterium]